MSSIKRAFLRSARLARETDGSVTLDASLVFPVILLATFMLLFFALYIGQQAIVYYSASTAGERAAFNWNNSAKEFRTGAYPEGSYDGLYWRLANDAMLAGLFGTSASEGGGVAFGGSASSGDDSGGDSLTVRKLRAAADPLATSLDGEMRYANRVLERQVRTEAGSPAAPQPLRNFWPDASLSADVSAVVVEPAEFIRTFDLLRYYAAKIKNATDGGAAYKSKAKTVLDKRKL